MKTMRFMNVFKNVGLVFCCLLALNASASNYVSASAGGENKSATGGLDTDYLTSNYEINKGYDIGLGVVSLLMPQAVDEVVDGMGGNVVGYVRKKLINGAAEAYNVDITPLIDAMTPRYGEGTVVEKTKTVQNSQSILSTLRMFSFENALMYFNVMLLTLAGIVISTTFFKSMWAMMTVSDGNASYRRLLMVVPSVAISIFSLMPTANGLSAGQMVLLSAFLVSNYVGSVLVTIPSLFFPIIAVDSAFTFNVFGANANTDPQLVHVMDATKAEVNIAARNMFFSETVMEAWLDSGLLDATIGKQMLHDAVGGDMDEYGGGLNHPKSPFVGGADVSYTNAFISEKAEQANQGLMTVKGITIFKRDPKCITSPDWDQIFTNNECQAWFRLSQQPYMLSGTNKEVFKTALGNSFYKAVKAREIEMKKVACNKLDASERVSSFVCQIKDQNGFTGTQYGEIKPDIASILNYNSFKDTPLYGEVVKTYHSYVDEIVSGKHRDIGTGKDGQEHKKGSEKAVIYVRGIMSTPYQILTKLMGDDGKNLVVNARDTSATKIVNDLAGAVFKMPRIDLLQFINYTNASLGSNTLYSRLACDQNSDFCAEPTTDQHIVKQLRVFTVFDNIFYSVLTQTSAQMLGVKKSDGADGLFRLMFPTKDRNTACLFNGGRGCMEKGQTPLSAPRADGMHWLKAGLYGWIVGEIVESGGNMIRNFSSSTVGGKLVFAGSYIKFVSNVCLAVGVGLCYLGIFVYIAITMKMYFRCVVRLLVALLAQPVVAVAFMLNGFNEIRTDTENMTTSKFFAQSVVRLLVDCVCLSVSVIVSLTLVLFAQGIMSVVARIYLWGVLKTDNPAGVDWSVNVIFQLTYPFIMCWCIWKCARLIPYLFEKIGDFVEDRTGVRMQDDRDMVAEFKKLMNPRSLYGG